MSPFDTSCTRCDRNGKPQLATTSPTSAAVASAPVNSPVNAPIGTANIPLVKQSNSLLVNIACVLLGMILMFGAMTIWNSRHAAGKAETAVSAADQTAKLDLDVLIYNTTLNTARSERAPTESILSAPKMHLALQQNQLLAGRYKDGELAFSRPEYLPFDLIGTQVEKLRYLVRK
jgi:hypothetical protein